MGDRGFQDLGVWVVNAFVSNFFSQTVLFSLRRNVWKWILPPRSETQFLEYLSVGSFGTVYKHQSSLRWGRSTVGTLETSRIVWDLGLVPL